MKKLNVWVNYQPQIFSDLFTQLLQHIGNGHLPEDYLECHNQINNGDINWEEVDIIVLSINERGKPILEELPKPLPKAKYIAFSPYGDWGMRRMPEAKRWEKLKPFGMDRLLYEVFGDVAFV